MSDETEVIGDLDALEHWISSGEALREWQQRREEARQSLCAILSALERDPSLLSLSPERRDACS